MAMLCCSWLLPFSPTCPRYLHIFPSARRHGGYMTQAVTAACNHTLRVGERWDTDTHHPHAPAMQPALPGCPSADSDQDGPPPPPPFSRLTVIHSITVDSDGMRCASGTRRSRPLASLSPSRGEGASGQPGGAPWGRGADGMRDCYWPLLALGPGSRPA